MNTLQRAIQDAADALEEGAIWRIQNDSDDDDIVNFDPSMDDIRDILGPYWDDVVTEVADSAVPVYFADQIRCLADDPGISGNIADHGYEAAGDILQDTATSIYLEIERALRDHDVGCVDSVVQAIEDKRDAILDTLWHEWMDEQEEGSPLDFATFKKEEGYR